MEWEDFRRRLIRPISDWEVDHPAGECWSYYRCWLTALEGVLEAQGMVGDGELDARAAALAARPAGHDHTGHTHEGHTHEGHPHEGHPHEGHPHEGHPHG